jgi:hypothetical protein
VKNSVSQLNNAAGIKARASDLKFKVAEMHTDFIDAILAECVKLDSLKHCRELKAVDAYYKGLSEIDPDTIAFPHLWPLYELIDEVFLTLNRPSSDHGENHFARLFEPPNVHLSLASYQSHIKPAIDYLQSLQITDTVVLRDHLEAVSNVNFIAACAHNKASPKDISSAYLTILCSIENEQAKDTNTFTMLRFKPFKDELRRTLSSIQRGDGSWGGQDARETQKASYTANRIKALEQEVKSLRTFTPTTGAAGGAPRGGPRRGGAAGARGGRGGRGGGPRGGGKSRQRPERLCVCCCSNEHLAQACSKAHPAAVALIKKQRQERDEARARNAERQLRRLQTQAGDQEVTEDEYEDDYQFEG